MPTDQTVITRAVRAALTAAGASLPPDQIAAIVAAETGAPPAQAAVPIGDDHGIAAALARAVGANTIVTTL